MTKDNEKWVEIPFSLNNEVHRIDVDLTPFMESTSPSREYRIGVKEPAHLSQCLVCTSSVPMQLSKDDGHYYGSCCDREYRVVVEAGKL